MVKVRKWLGKGMVKRALACFLTAALAAPSVCSAPAKAAEPAEAVQEEQPHLTTWVEKNKRAPMVWSTIQYGGNARNYSRIIKNIDWLAENWTQYGYNYAVLDGWLAQANDGSTAPWGSYHYNKNGYLISPYKQWEEEGGSYESFAKYCLERGITPGVYYNPMWVYKRTVNDVDEEGNPNNINPTVVGTDIPLRDIINTGDSPIGTSEGRDGKDKADFQSWYYVDPNKEGAKEYMQGMIKYFKDMGYGFMKIDFIRQGHYFYGQEAMEKCYRWWREAAGDDFIISLANARQVNYMEAEAEYADLNRISADTNGWKRLCEENRGRVQRSEWDTMRNGFDSYNYFADRGGDGPKSGAVILDGDHTRTNQLTADETKFSISLKVLGGGGIQMSDTVENSISDAVGGAKPWAFQNQDMIDLVKEGFFAKPLKAYERRDVTQRGTYSVTEQTYEPKTQIYAGQAQNGDWVVGLFNREDTAQTRAIDFKEDLGVDGVFQATDLWEHKVVGNGLERWSEELPAHACRILRLHKADYVQLSESSLALSIHGGEGSHLLTAAIFSEDESKKEVRWTSSNTDVVTVENGMVTAIGTGTAVVTAASAADPELKAECTVRVTDAQLSLEKITLSETEAELNVGMELALSALLEPEYAGNKEVVWSSSQPAVASVEDGKVTALGLGETRIRCSSAANSSVYGECLVKVTPNSKEYGEVIGISLNKNVVSALPGKSVPLHASLINAEEDSELVWKSLDENVATVDNKGNVTITGAGVTTVQVRVKGQGSYAASCIVLGATEGVSYETELSKGHKKNGTSAKTNKNNFSNKAGTGNIGNSATNNFLLMDVEAPEAGAYNFGLYYAQNKEDTQDTGKVEGGASRSVYVTADGGVTSKYLILQGTIANNFNTPEQEPASVTINLQQGTNELKLYNPEGWCSDLDKVSITKSFGLAGVTGNVQEVRNGGKTFFLKETVISGTQEDLIDYGVASSYTIYHDGKPIGTEEVEGQTGAAPVQSSGGRTKMNGFVFQRDYTTDAIDASAWTEAGNYTVVFTAEKDGVKAESQPVFLMRILTEEEEVLKELAASAKQAKAEAEEAKRKAEEAQAAAEQAKTEAEAAKAEAEIMKKEAETAKTEAEQAKTEAEAAKEAAQAAQAAADKAAQEAEEKRAAAEQAKEDAEAIRKQAGEESAAAKAAAKEADEKLKAAEAAKTAAETAKAAAETAKQEANAAAVEANGKLEAANAAAAQAETARQEAEAAKEAAEAVRKAAETERQAAEQAKKAAEAAQAAAEAERQAVEQAKAAAEAERVAAEEAKKKAEAERIKAEEANKKAEAERQAAEEARKKAEAERQAAEEAKKAAAAALEEAKKARDEAKLAQKAAEKAKQESINARDALKQQAKKIPKVALKSVKKKNGSIQVTWKKLTNVSGYKVKYSTNKSFQNPKFIKVGASKNSCLIKKPKKGKKYYIKVHAYRKINGNIMYGSYGKSKSIKIK